MKKKYNFPARVCRGARKRIVARPITIIERMSVYLNECARRGADWVRFCCAEMARRLNVSLRSVKAVRAALESTGAFRFERRRIGRSTCLFVVFGRSPDVTRPEGVQGAKIGGIGGKGDFLPENKAKLKRLPAFSAKGSVDVEKRLKGKAWAVARECLAKHWDNCKVRESLRHAYCYALRALRAGRRAEDIVAAYDAALHQRHKDATDMGLSCGNPSLKWSPSSTVSLAAAMLAKAATLTDDQRKAKRAAAWVGALNREQYAALRSWVAAAGEPLDALFDGSVELFAIVGRFMRRQQQGGAAA